MPTVLDEIIDGVREDLAVRAALVSLDELKSRVEEMAPARDALGALMELAGFPQFTFFEGEAFGPNSRFGRDEVHVYDNGQVIYRLAPPGKVVRSRLSPEGFSAFMSLLINGSFPDRAPDTMTLAGMPYFVCRLPTRPMNGCIGDGNYLELYQMVHRWCLSARRVLDFGHAVAQTDLVDFLRLPDQPIVFR